MSSPYFKVEPWECENEEDRVSPSLEVPVPPPPRCEDEVEASDVAEGAPDEWKEMPETPAPRSRSVDNAAATGPPCGGGGA